VLDGTSENPEDSISTAWLRQLAGIQYSTSQAGITVPEMSRMPPFDHVSIRTLEGWCAYDHWEDKRKEYFARLRDQIEQRLAASVVETRVQHLQRIDSIAEAIIADIESKEVGYKSREGMITALVKLLEVGDRMREKVAARIAPKLDCAGVLTLTAELSEDEARAAAKLIMKTRREKLRAGLPSPEIREQDSGEPGRSKMIRRPVCDGKNNGETVE
jgi:hypothetical protein